MTKNTWHFALVACFAFAFSACSSTEEKAALQNRVTAHVGAASKAKPGYIAVYRPSAFFGYALNTSVHVNDILVADLDPGTHVKVKAAPGRYAVYSDEEAEVLSTEVTSGRTSYFRVELVPGFWKGHGKLVAVDEATGALQLPKGAKKIASDIRQPSMVVR